jgi:hypothetical protein
MSVPPPFNPFNEDRPNPEDVEDWDPEDED